MTVFRLYNGSVMKEELEKYHKKNMQKDMEPTLSIKKFIYLDGGFNPNID